MTGSDRVVLLGEDRAHREFLLELSVRAGWEVVDENFAPPGEGAASQWVLARFDELAREITDGSDPGLKLVVIIDGDGVRWAARRQELLKHCTVPIPANAPLAFLVPAWSIDTWALFFHKDLVLDEDQKSKPKAKNLYRSMPHKALAPGVPQALPPPGWKPSVLAALVNGFLGDKFHGSLPSLAASREHFRRIRGISTGVV